MVRDGPVNFELEERTFESSDPAVELIGLDLDEYRWITVRRDPRECCDEIGMDRSELIVVMFVDEQCRRFEEIGSSGSPGATFGHG